MFIEEEEDVDNVEHEFNGIATNQPAALDPQYLIDTQAIKEILLLQRAALLLTRLHRECAILAQKSS